MNIYQKLNKARSEFLHSGVTKSGKHYQLEFKYFELEDIIPIATKIFNEIGLIAIDTFNNENATLKLINTDKVDETIEFNIPVVEQTIIVSKTGKAVINEIQALGSLITYYRRYLYMVLLDIVELDTIDGNLGNVAKKETKEQETQTKQVAKKPLNKEQRTEVQKELTTTNGIDIEQINSIIKAYNELIILNEDYTAVARNHALETNNFSTLTSQEAIELIKTLNSKIIDLQK